MSKQRRAAAAAAPAPRPRAAPAGVRASAAPLVALLLATFSFAVYLANLRPMGQIDTLPTRLLAFSIARERDFDLDEFPWLRRSRQTAVIKGADGRSYSYYPVATALLATPIALPAVAWLEAGGIADDDVRFRVAALVVERIAAALFAALSVALVYVGLCALTTARLAAAIALAYAFATNTWATSSQALWQHGPAALCLAGLSLCLLRAATPGHLLAAGGFAALGVAVRPTMVFFAALALLFVWRRRRRHAAPFLLFPVLTAALLLAYNLSISAAAAGGGYATLGGSFSLPSPERFLGLLISPNRGLFVYTPLAALPLVALALRRPLPAPWLKYLLAGMAAHAVFYASFQLWWAGNVYGPRYFAELLPAVALCAVPAVEYLCAAALGRAALLVLLAWSVAVQVVGVYCDDGSWNITPYTITYKPERAWDWRDPQILRAARAGWHGGDFAALLRQFPSASPPALLRPMQAADLAGEIAFNGATPLRVGSGERLRLSLRVTNRGALAWPAFSDHGYLQVGILSRWWSGENMLDDAGEVIRLPRNLAPGESDSFPASVEAPRRPGDHHLELLVVQELDPTQGVFGGADLRLAVRVE